MSLSLVNGPAKQLKKFKEECMFGQNSNHVTPPLDLHCAKMASFSNTAASAV